MEPIARAPESKPTDGPAESRWWSARRAAAYIGAGPKVEDVLFAWRITGHFRYFGPEQTPIHETGVEPGIRVEQPEIEFGVEPPAGDRTLDRAIDHLSQQRRAA